jgi:hypothetical protein
MSHLYRVIVRQTELLEYSIEADSAEEARLCLCSGDEQVAQSHNEDWEVVDIQQSVPTDDRS